MDVNTFKLSKTFKKKGIDIYSFVICKDMKKKIENISKLLNIKKLPKKLFDKNTYNLDNDFQKILYLDDYEIVFTGLDKKEECSSNALYNVYGKLGYTFSDYEIHKNKNILVYLVNNDIENVKNQVISYILGMYKFEKYKTDLDKKNITTYFYHPKMKFHKIIEDSIQIATVQNEIRTITNMPANILNSTVYSKYIKNHLPNDIKMTVINQKKLISMGFNLILAVNKGSKNEPMMIVIEYYNAPKKEKPIVLIGKGVMFDTGGYNIKGGDFSDMKEDKAGSAIVYGIFKLLSQFKLKGNFIGLLPIVENMVDANSTRPGDIVVAYNKKSVEIVDTDAEGRLILADALAYAEKFKPKLCIDIATLTGQAASIFGNKSTVIMGNNNKEIQNMIKAGMINNEKMWELPMWKEYLQYTKSEIADYKNYSPDTSAGTIIAGAFLYNFVPYGCDWLHLDIAGVDYLYYDKNNRNMGATSVILRSVFHFLENL
jgi:leucyl aminopeptidase